MVVLLKPVLIPLYVPKDEDPSMYHNIIYQILNFPPVNPTLVGGLGHFPNFPKIILKIQDAFQVSSHFRPSFFNI